MRQIIKKVMISIGQLSASVALLIAVYSVNSTCMFMTYQPDIPEGLRRTDI